MVHSFDNTSKGVSKKELQASMGDLRHQQRKIYTSKDPRFASAPSFSFGSRSINELNTLACNRSFFCKNGTHRCTDGEILLDPLRRRDDKSQAKLRDHGRQWKAVPGPGSYRVPRFLGDIDQVREFSLGKSAFPWHAPSWSLDGQSLRPALYHTTGGVNGFYQREAKPDAMGLH
eukprot:g2091.t1